MKIQSLIRLLSFGYVMPKKAQVDSTRLDQRRERLGRLWWLIDAPLFIDETLVRRFHDAIIHPNWEVTHRQISERDSESSKLAAELKAGGKASGPSLLSFLGLNLEVSAEATGGVEGTTEKEKSTTSEAIRVMNPERRLLEIYSFYLQGLPERLLMINLPLDATEGGIVALEDERKATSLDALIADPPRQLVFMDLAPQTVIIPTVAEAVDGKYEFIYGSIVKRLWAEAEQAPRYPGDREASVKIRREYWKAISERFETRIGMEEIEYAATRIGRFEWINFRVCADSQGQTFHLHCAPSGKFSAGVFGYNFVRRGFRHGTRIVGTLRAGNSINVMAIYER